MISTIIFLAAFGVVSSTSDVQSDEPVPTTRAPHVIPVYHDVGLRHHPHHQEPGFTVRTDSTTATSSPTTEPNSNRNLYTIDYQEATRRGRTDVTIHLVPLTDLRDVLPEGLDIFIEYNRRIRRIKKVWGGEAKVAGHTVFFTTKSARVARNLSFGYTIDNRSRRGVLTANPPVFMDIRMAEELQHD